MTPNLSIEISGIRMENPVMNAAGTFEVEPMREFFDINRLGAFIQKSVTRRAREGNPQPRIFETASGMINRIGLQNVGVEAFIAEKLPRLMWLGIPIIINVAGESVDDYCETCLILQERVGGWIQALEINVSCPNVKDGLVFGSNPDLLSDLIKNIRSIVSFPLIVKLTPNVTDIGLIAKAAIEAGADALSLINTVKAAAFIKSGSQAGQWIEGGLSGPAIKPVALMKIREVSKAVSVPLIGIGGIYTVEDVLDFLRIKNVWAIAVGTASFLDPLTMINIIDGLRKYMAEKNYADISELKKGLEK